MIFIDFIHKETNSDTLPLSLDSFDLCEKYFEFPIRFLHNQTEFLRFSVDDHGVCDSPFTPLPVIGFARELQNALICVLRDKQATANLFGCDAKILFRLNEGLVQCLNPLNQVSILVEPMEFYLAILCFHARISKWAIQFWPSLLNHSWLSDWLCGKTGKMFLETKFHAYQIILRIKESIFLDHPHFCKKPFEPGIWVYCGSAKKNFLSQIHRHALAQKSLKWHIDWLTVHSGTELLGMVAHTTSECALNQALKSIDTHPGFGSSDCQKCLSHLQKISEDPNSLQWMELSATRTDTSRRKKHERIYLG